jgi:hypothetical protein
MGLSIVPYNSYVEFKSAGLPGTDTAQGTWRSLHNVGKIRD